MSKKLLMNNTSSEASSIINLPYALQGSGTYLGDNTYEITDDSSWDNARLYNSTLLELKQYNLHLIILERNLLDGYSLTSTYTYAITHNELNGPLKTAASTVDIGTETVISFTIYQNTNATANIAGLQFNTANTGSYIKFKIWITE
nr:MAG TPA: hypothetical protein [Caudoviricetes sp.]